MKTRTKVSIFAAGLGLFFLAGALQPMIGYAIPYGSEALGPDGALVSAEPAYLPSRKLTIPEGASEYRTLSSPESLCVDKETDTVYLADTGNARIVSLSGESQATFAEVFDYENGDGAKITFSKPTGVYVNSTSLYVADKGLQKIVVLDKETLEFKREFSRPESQLVGTATKFSPTKVCADDSGNVYCVLEGSTKGVMQLDDRGEFVAYVGANNAQITLLSRLQSFFGVTSDDYMLSAGAAVTNICLDSKGLLYTVTNNSASCVKKLNTSGNAVLTMNYDDKATVSAFVDDDGNIFTVQSNGYLTAYDSYGSLLFRFGGRNDEEILGSLNSPVGSAMLSNGELLILDKESGIVVSYEPTRFAKLIYQAVRYYKDGLYLEGEESWNELLRYNAKFILAYKALAKASMKKGDYDTALHQFKLAEDREGYSEAFWQVRDRWIRANLGWVLLPIVIVVVAVAGLKLVYKLKPAALSAPISVWQRGKKAPVVNETLLMFSFIKSPRDVIYEIKYKGRASIYGAIFLYVLFAAIQILKVYLTGYLFNDVGRSDGLRTILLSTIPLLFLVFCNYAVSSVRDGEGKLRDIFIGFIYALSPYLILALPMFLLSNVLTYNEAAIFHLVEWAVYIWCGVNLVLTVMELHDYSLGQALINILLTVVCFVLLIAFALILYALGYQLFSYFGSVIQEVFTR
ncbi:MAG: hypothetical protein K6F32_03895 [Bacilli bacterium]|nr:hypothetical protein [Bacilli bacterium]